MRSLPARSLLVSAALMALLAIAPVAAKPPYVPIEQRLSAEQLRATGLDTLSPDQLRLLNELLSEDRETVAREAAATRSTSDAGLREKRAPEQAVSGTVNGKIQQWSKGDTVLLDNGQRWRVVDGGVYLRRAITNPKVTIAPGFLGAWYLQIDGEAPKVKVQRVD